VVTTVGLIVRSEGGGGRRRRRLRRKRNNPSQRRNGGTAANRIDPGHSVSLFLRCEACPVPSASSVSSSSVLSVPSISGTLGVTSARTWQRRLAAEGVSYQELVDRSKKDAAARYVADSTLPICEIAFLLGYSEPAPFHRAFRRWYHTTPEAFRKAARGGDGRITLVTS